MAGLQAGRETLLENRKSGGTALAVYTATYDPVGNRLEKVESAGTTEYPYNEADELLLITPPSGQPTTQTWDANENLLTEQTGEDLTAHSTTLHGLLLLKVYNMPYFVRP